MSYKINIPEPCHEDWQNMSPTEKGRFCSACEKEVFDFSKQSNQAIYTHLNQSNSFCGRFTTAQLQSTYKATPKSNLFKLYTAVAAIGLGSLLPIDAFTQTQEIPTSIAQRDNKQIKKDQKTSIKTDSTSSRTINGFVYEEEGLPAIGVTIRISDTKIGAISGIDGDFMIEVDEKYIKNNHNLSISYIGLEEPITIPLNTIDFETGLNIILPEFRFFLGGAVVITKTRPRLWQRVKNIFRKKNKNEEITCESEEEHE